MGDDEGGVGPCAAETTAADHPLSTTMCKGGKGDGCGSTRR